MIKRSILAVFLVLLLSGCATERGAMVPVKLTQKHVQKYLDKNESIPTLVLRDSRDDTVQKSISGSLILIIGLILIL